MRRTVRRLPVIGTSVDLSRTTLAVLLGDLTMVFAFIAVGQYTHGLFFWELPVHTALVTIPFLIAWLVVAPTVGLFDTQRIGSLRATVPTVVFAWILTTAIGSLLRGSSLFPGGVQIGFVAATLAFGLLFVGGWRIALVWYFSR